jgi:hypothetical protein
MSSRRGLVAASSQVRPVRAHRLLRQLAGPTRHRTRAIHRPSCHPKFRARRGLVLPLSQCQVFHRTGTCSTDPPPPRSERPGPGIKRPYGLAATPALTAETHKTRLAGGAAEGGLPQAGPASSAEGAVDDDFSWGRLQDGEFLIVEALDEQFGYTANMDRHCFGQTCDTGVR